MNRPNSKECSGFRVLTKAEQTTDKLLMGDGTGSRVENKLMMIYGLDDVIMNRK
jgi:hypothetical protein